MSRSSIPLFHAPWDLCFDTFGIQTYPRELWIHAWRRSGVKRDIQISISKKEQDSAHVEELPVFHGGYLSISRNPSLNQHLTYEKGRLRRRSISPCASTPLTRNTLFPSWLLSSYATLLFYLRVPFRDGRISPTLSHDILSSEGGLASSRTPSPEIIGSSTRGEWWDLR